jgi:CheY-like chemotaxis protein
LKKAAESLQTAAAADEFASLQVDLEKTLAECDRMAAMMAETPAGGAPQADVAQPEREESPVRRAPDSGNAGGKVWRLLVVDDNDAGRELLCRKLRRQGYSADDAASGKTALEKLQHQAFDLVLLDVMMPDMDGFEVLDRLREMGRLDRLPVIMITAIDDTQSLIRCLEMGAEDYLTKPYDPLLLRASLTSALERKRIRDEDQRTIAELTTVIAEMEEKSRVPQAESAARKDTSAES